MTENDVGRLNGLETVEVILMAGDIPLGSKVRKVNGSKVFTLGDKMVLYTENAVKKEIEVDPSSRILLSSGDFIHNAIGATKKLVWVAPVRELLACLDEVPQ